MYIPGGGYRDGSGNVPVYNGENLAKKGLVVVTINYRVGVFGFFANPELTAESEHHASGNYGLMDPVAALEWIRDNIGVFGGDPESVTIMGQSAGAMSVHGLIVSPLASGLFARAIAQSGSRVNLGPGMDLASAERAGEKFAKDIGAASLAELRAIPARELLDFAYDHYTFRPIVDGWFLPQNVDEIVAVGEQNDVPMLTGFVADEGSYGDDYGKVPMDEFRKQIKQQTGALADKILELYPAETQSQCDESQVAYTRDMTLVSMYLWARNSEKTGKSDIYTYLFTHQQPGPTQERYKAFHSSELPYVFDNLDPSYRPWTAQDTLIAGTTSSYWVNFIKTGNPNGEGLPAWPSFNEAPQEIMELGDTMGPRPIASGEKIDVLIKLLQ